MFVILFICAPHFRQALELKLHKEPAQGSEPYNEADGVCISLLPTETPTSPPPLDQGVKFDMNHEIITKLLPLWFPGVNFGTALERRWVLDE